MIEFIKNNIGLSVCISLFIIGLVLNGASFVDMLQFGSFGGIMIYFGISVNKWFNNA